MLISHEVPPNILSESLKFNDYDYALVHLFEKYPDYLKFYEKSLKSGRIVYLDNSLFELKKAFDHKKFKIWCDKLADINEENFYYIAPDSFYNTEVTIENFKKFNARGKKIGVVQFKNFDGVLRCLDAMRSEAAVIAFPSTQYNTTNLEVSMNLRISLMHKLKNLGLLEGLKIHLLGCNLPQEFKHYTDIPEIFSVDTSNPIIHGLLNIPYTSSGLSTKSKLGIESFFNIKESNATMKFNVMMFREFTKGLWN